MNQTFSIKQTILDSWKIVKKNLKFFALLSLVAWVIQFIPSYINGQLTNTFLLVLMSILSWLIDAVVTIGLITITLKYLKNGNAIFQDALGKISHFIPYLIGSIYYSLIVLAGMILLIVPGVMWALRYQFFGYLIIDKGLKPKEALTKSKEMTKGKLGKLFLFSLALLGVNLLGLLALGFGLLITIPVSLMAVAKVYKSLLGEDVVTSTSTTTTSPNTAKPTTNVWKDYRKS